MVELESIIKLDPDTYKKVPWIISKVQFEARRKDLFTIDILKKFMLIRGGVGANYISKDCEVIGVLLCESNAEVLCLIEVSVTFERG